MKSMSRNLRKNSLPFLLFFCFICGIVIIAEVRFKLIQRGYDHFVLDNRNHFLSCQELPPTAQVEQIVAQHKDVIQRIRHVAPGFVGVEIDSLVCQGKADLLIWYGTHEQRVAIENIIADDTFFGIPYRLQNR